MKNIQNGVKEHKKKNTNIIGIHTPDDDDLWKEKKMDLVKKT